MTARDFENYINVFEIVVEFIHPPDLLIYLRASLPTLVGNIQLRGRDYEAGIRLDYLSKLNDKYEKWISYYDGGKLLVLDKDKLDFENNTDDLSYVLDSVNREINGLFYS